MPKQLTLLVLLSLCSYSTQAQEEHEDHCHFEISGIVYDAETKAPLPFATIRLEDTPLGTVSDSSGYFTIADLCDDEYDIVFSFLGYKTVSHHHDFHHPPMEIFLAPDHVDLESIVVEASDVTSDLNSMTTAKISREELGLISSLSLGDAASQIAGVNTISTGQNIVKPVIHGLHSNRILVINNSIRHEFQNWSEGHAPEIDPSVIDQIEVVKGAATVRFGPDALGGVVLVNPPHLELSTPLEGKFNLTGKSNGRSGEALGELRKGFKWLSILAGGSFVQQGDLHTPKYSLTNTGKEEKSYYAGLRIHPFSTVDVDLYYSRFEQELGILSGSVFGNLEDLQRAIGASEPLLTQPFSYDIGQPKQIVSHDLFKASARYIDDRQSLNLIYGHQMNMRKEFGVRRTDAPNIDLQLKTQSLDLDYRHPNLGNLSGRVGIQLLSKDNENLPGTNTVPFIPNYEEKRIGAYLIESHPVGKGSIEAGLRFDYLESEIVGREPDNTIYRNTILYRNFSGTLGIKYPLGAHTTFRSNIGTAWRAPNVAELYRFGQHSFFIEYGLWRHTFDERFDFVSTREGILDETDRQVQAEESLKWINSLSWNGHGRQLEISAYVNYIDNYIFSRPAGVTRTPRGNFVFFIYDQAEALLWGADLDGSWEHSKKFTSEFQASILWSQQLNPRDFFAGQPPPNIRYKLRFRPGISFLSSSTLSLGFNYTMRQFQHPRVITAEEFINAHQNDITRFSASAPDFDLLPPPSSFLLTHVEFSTAWKDLGLRIRVDNLFNVSYRNYTDRLRYFADDMGRNIAIDLSWTF